MTKRRRIAGPARRLTSLPPCHETTRSMWSPMISGQSDKAKPEIGFPRHVLDLHADTPGGGRRVVDRQLAALEIQRLGQQFTARIGSPHRHEPIRPQGQTFDVVRLLAEVAVHVDGYLRRTGGNDPAAPDSWCVWSSFWGRYPDG